jgi:WD40 repeat protein
LNPLAVFSPVDPNLIALSQRQGTITVFDLNTHTAIQTFTYEDNIADLVFSPDGHLLFTSHWGGAIEIWNLDTSAHEETLTREYITTTPITLAYHPSEPLLAGATRQPIIWNVETRSFVASYGPVEESNVVRFDPSGTFLLSKDELSGGITVWNVVDKVMWKQMETYRSASHDMEFGRHDELLAVSYKENYGGDAAKSVELWDFISSDSYLTELPYGQELAFSRDGRLLISAEDHTIVVRGVRS